MAGQWHNWNLNPMPIVLNSYYIAWHEPLNFTRKENHSAGCFTYACHGLEGEGGSRCPSPVAGNMANHR